MNTEKDLLKRVLKLYPVDKLKTYFNEKGKASEVIAAVVHKSKTQDIHNFIFNHASFTRQFIHLFKTNKKGINLKDIKNWPLTKISDSSDDLWQKAAFLHKVKFKVILLDPFETAHIEFYHPIFLSIYNDKYVIISYTKLDKNPTSYFPSDRTPLKSGSVNEKEGLALLLEFLIQELNTNPIDINKGIKHLWDKDYLDSQKVEWRNENSVDTVNMDEESTFKVLYPERYKVIIKSPLNKTTFVYLKKDDKLCNAFEVDPSKGILNIPRFSKTINQVENVITKIFEHN